MVKMMQDENIYADILTRVTSSWKWFR